MEKVSKNKYRIVEHYSARRGDMEYIVQEQHIGWKGKEKWEPWIWPGLHCWHLVKYSSIAEAEAEIAKIEKERNFVPKVVKEL